MLLADCQRSVFLPNTILLVPSIHGAGSIPDAEREWSMSHSYRGFTRGALVQAYRSGIGPPPLAQGEVTVRIGKLDGPYISHLDTEGLDLGSKASGGRAGTSTACCSCEKQRTPRRSCPEGLQGDAKRQGLGTKRNDKQQVTTPGRGDATTTDLAHRGATVLVARHRGYGGRSRAPPPKSSALRAQRCTARNPGVVGKAAYRSRFLSFLRRAKDRDGQDGSRTATESAASLMRTRSRVGMLEQPATRTVLLGSSTATALPHRLVNHRRFA